MKRHAGSALALVTLLAIAAAFVLAACGGDARQASRSTSEPGGEATATAPEAPPRDPALAALDTHLADKPYVYVAVFSPKKGATAQIDATTDKKVADVPLGSYYSELAMKPDGTEVWALAPTKNRADVIDTKTRKVVRTIELADGPSCVAFAPNGATYLVAHSLSDYVSLHDAATNKELGRVTVGKSPYTVRLNHQGTKAYVGFGMSVPDPSTIMKTRKFEVRQGAKEVVGIEVPSLKVTGRVPTLGNSVGISWRPDGAVAYAVSREIVIPDIAEIMKNPEKFAGQGGARAEVVVIDAEKDAVLKKLPVAAQDLAFNPDGTKCYCLLADGVTVVDGQSHEVKKTIAADLGG